MKRRYTSSASLFWATCTLCAPLHAQSLDEITFAKTVLGDAQTLSLRHNREYCGYLFYDQDGALGYNEPRRGRKSSCRPRDPGDGVVIFASYHTHGRLEDEHGYESPSSTDVEGDEAEGIDGFVATPGGRLWYVDTDLMEVRQICGAGCLEQDPDYWETPDIEILQSYTYEELVELEGG